MISGLIVLLVACIQGLVVFGTAYAIWNWRNFKSVWIKPPLIIASWLSWCILTIAGYAAIGGDGGMMDGFGLVLFLCITAFLGSLLFMLGWLLA